MEIKGHFHKVSTLNKMMRKTLKNSPKDYYFMKHKPCTYINRRVLNYVNPVKNLKHIKRGAEKNRKNNMINQKRMQKFKDIYIMKSGKNIFPASDFNEFVANKFYEKFYIIELLNAIYAVLSIILGLVHYEMTYEQKESNKINSCNTMLYFITFFSILLWLNAIFYHILQVRILKSKGYLKNEETIFSTNKWMYIILEIGIFFVHPNILFVGKTFTTHNNIYLVDSEKSANSILNIFLLVRFFYLFRFIVYLINYMDPITNQICNTYFFKVNFLFSIKVLFKNYPFSIYIIFSTCFIFSFSYCVRIFERDLIDYSHQDFNNIWNVWWYIIITMLTVGYGDYSAKTNEGRVFAMGACIAGVFLTSMMLISVSNYLELTVVERTVFNIMNKVEENEEISQISRTLIRKFGEFSIKNKKIENKKTTTLNSTNENNLTIGIKELADEFNRKCSNKVYDLIAPPLKTAINSMTFLIKEFNDLKSKQNKFFVEISEIKMEMNSAVMLLKNNIL